ncbi:hypothetical protein CC80DRAFT_536808 [Byssothecium circinans]|uniref:BZIP domain-containing protein n=1 Tax=Byssothecium circinans TaxID=147558 RepID=A0A6A5TP40_9PLEO|nr:hypothetical protein CC80DRAFT_536808 [Byssothecium circinans]
MGPVSARGGRQENMPSSDSDGQPPSKKRSRTSANAGEEVGNKKRGRPRVDTQDETAADRRRTQIRLAQRAYRLRKETTISSLQEKNARLQSIVDQMNKNFLQFNDAAVQSGLLQLHPNLGQQLKQVTETFVTLAKSASEESLEEDEEAGDATEIAHRGVQNAAKAEPQAQIRQEPTQTEQFSRKDIGWGYSAAPPDASRQTNSKSPENKSQGLGSIFYPMPNRPFGNERETSLVSMRRPVHVGNVMDQCVSWSSESSEERDTSDQLPFGIVHLLNRQQYPPAHGIQDPQIYSLDIPTPDLTSPMKRLPTPPYLPSLSTKRLATPPWTFSHDETTFARRLNRAATEAGFHILSSSEQSLGILKHIFRLSLPFKSLEELLERFKSMLSRGVDEELDTWDHPFSHLGGAGTHYPRKLTVDRPHHWVLHPRIGPFSSNIWHAENTEDPSKSCDIDVDLTGFDGEWFDADDVEGYLEREKGCRIDPKSSFAEVLIDDDEEPVQHEAEDYNVASHAFRWNYLHPPPPPRRASDVQSETPSFGAGSSSSGSTSTRHSPTHDGSTAASIDTLLARSEAPFGLGMGMNLPTTAANQFAPADFERFGNFFNQTLGLDLSPGFDLSHTVSNFPPMDFDKDVDIGALGLDLMGGSGPAMGTLNGSKQMPIVMQKPKKTVCVEVSKLVEANEWAEIIKHAVCLGRAPGFRRDDIDKAVQASIIR